MCIYCDMEQETILYYYPMPQETAEKNNRYAAKKHWFQEAVLKTDMMAEQKEFCILGCAIPPFYYRRKPWKPRILSETMETVLGDASGMTDTCVHPQIRNLLTEEYCSKWMPREETMQMLIKYLLEQYVPKALEKCSTVTLLLGGPADTDRQMETTWKLLQPYLPRVNRMLIYYERREKEQDAEERGNFEWEDRPEQSRQDKWQETIQENDIPEIKRHHEGAARFKIFGTEKYRRDMRRPGGIRKADNYEEAADLDLQEEMQEYLEAYYYEYGLVPQMEPYRMLRMNSKPIEGEANYLTGEGRTPGVRRNDELISPQNGSLTEAEPKLCCGKEKCGGVILDFSDQFRYPKILSEDSVYIDMVSSAEKERRFRQKSLAVPYVSPLKYLDTVVKNSYDRKVKMT